MFNKKPDHELKKLKGNSQRLPYYAKRLVEISNNNFADSSGFRYNTKELFNLKAQALVDEHLYGNEMEYILKFEICR